MADDPVSMHTQPSQRTLERTAPNQYQIRAMLQCFFANHIWYCANADVEGDGDVRGFLQILDGVRGVFA